jgi:LytS/YehU family sensor histidine kinase
MGYYFVMKGIQNQKKITRLEKEKQDAEYAFLRSQVNPHLLNGTLKYIYDQTLPISKKLAADVAILRDIMLYSLQSDKDDRMVLLNHEIAHIRNVIKINQLRFNNRLEIALNIKGNTQEVKILPLILITVVENILKHGVCTAKEHPVTIDLEIDDVKGYIRLNTWNQNRKGPKELSTGIGLNNIKKRLTNHYQDAYSLIITASQNDYHLSLSVPFSRCFQKSAIEVTQSILSNNSISYQTSAI